LASVSDSPQSNIVPFASDRRGGDDPYIGESLKGIVASIKEMEQKNRELVSRNSKLTAALRQADDRIASFEQAASANPELTRLAFEMAAQVIESAEESVEASRRAVKENSADLYEEAINHATQLQRDALSLLEEARQRTEFRKRETDQRASVVFTQAKNSILSLGKELGTPVAGKYPAWARSVLEAGIHSEQPRSGEPSLPTGSEPIIEDSAPLMESNPPETEWEAASVLPVQIGGTLQPEGSPAEVDAHESQSSANVRPADQLSSDSGAPGILPHSIEMVVSPFRSFADITAFHKSLRQLPGVVDVKASSFGGGTMQFLVRHAGPFPLVGALMEMSSFDLELTSFTPERIEVRISSNEWELAPDGDSPATTRPLL